MTTYRDPARSLTMCVTSGRFGREMIADPYAVYHRLLVRLAAVRATRDALDLTPVDLALAPSGSRGEPI
jgi:hypothetical protein